MIRATLERIMKRKRRKKKVQARADYYVSHYKPKKPLTIDEKTLEAVLIQPPREPRDGRHIMLYRTLWQHPADGWSIAARAYARALHMVGVDVRLQSWMYSGPLDPEVSSEISELNLKQPVEWDSLVISSTLADEQHMIPILRGLQNSDGKRIFYTTFERRKVSETIIAELSKLDGVWVPCTANKKAFGNLPNVFVAPHPFFDDDPLLKLEPPTRQPFTYYWIGRFEPRKAPDNLIRAFMRAFKPGEAKLVLKLSPIDWPYSYITPEQVIEAEARKNTIWDQVKWREWIEIIRGHLSKKEIFDLHARGDVYVSASRGEGFDLPAFSAKLSGRRVVTTDSGGPKDFLGSEDLLVPANKVITADTRYKWGPGAVYNDYRIDDLVSALQHSKSLTSVRRDWPRSKFSASFVGSNLSDWFKAL